MHFYKYGTDKMLGLDEIKQFIKEKRMSLEKYKELLRHDGYDELFISTVLAKPRWIAPQKIIIGHTRYVGDKKNTEEKIVFKKSLLNYFIQVHEALYDHNNYNSYPIIFLLGKKRKYIDTAVTIDGSGRDIRDIRSDDHASGCGDMPGIPSSKLNEAIYLLMKEEAVPAGIARIGLYSGDYVGRAFATLKRQLNGKKDFCFLSIGCWEINAYVSSSINNEHFYPCDYAVTRG